MQSQRVGVPYEVAGAYIGSIAKALSYDARNNVRQIHVGPNPSTVQARDEFWYDADGQRFLGRESWDDNGTLRTRTVVYLGGDYEEVIPPTGGTHDRIQRVQVTSVVRLLQRRNATTQTWEAPYHEYAHRDHLGSVDAITDGSGTVLQKTSFDPYGGRRSTTWNADLPATSLDALRAVQDSRGSRGFTDHEQLNRTGFVCRATAQFVVKATPSVTHLRVGHHADFPGAGDPEWVGKETTVVGPAGRWGTAPPSACFPGSASRPTI